MPMLQTKSSAWLQSSNWFWYAGGAKVEACLRGISHHCRPVFSDAFAVLMRVSMFLLISSILKANCWKSSKTKSFYNRTQTSQQTPSSPKTCSTENKFIHVLKIYSIQQNFRFHYMFIDRKDNLVCILISTEMNKRWLHLMRVERFSSRTGVFFPSKVDIKFHYHTRAQLHI